MSPLSLEDNMIENDKKYWLSLEQWGNDPEFQKIAEGEFMSSPLREKDGEDGVARREFLKLMGASLALASAGCVRRPVQKIVPYANQPEEVTLGMANMYTSSYSDGAETLGLLVKTREGRPIKIEGNPLHPLSKGGTTARAQAHILSLYDPERLNGPKHNLLRKDKDNSKKDKTNFETIDIKWDGGANGEDLDTMVSAQLQKGSDVLLTGPVYSDSTRQLIGDFTEAFHAKHIVWEPLSSEDVTSGQKTSYGTAVLPFYRFDKAQVIVSVDADFLGTWLMPATFSRQFAEGRKNITKMNKLISFDSMFSLTGANADIRFKIKPSQQLDIVMGLLHGVMAKGGLSKYSSDSKWTEVLKQFANVPQKLGLNPSRFDKVVSDLIANKGKSLIVAGGPVAQTAKSKELQVAINLLNSMLENDGVTVDYKHGIPSAQSSQSEMNSLLKDMGAGKIKTLIIHGINPGYVYGEAFAAAVKKVDMIVYTGDRIDETGKFCDLIAPDNHALENWGDAEAIEGVYSIQQPTIRPLYDTRSFQLSLMTWAFKVKQGSKRLLDPESYYDYLRNFWKDSIYTKYGKGKSFEDFWEEILQEGVLNTLGTDFAGNSIGSFTGNSAVSRTAKVDSLYSAKPSDKSGFELVLHSTVQMGAGETSNISWLQELPDSVTKIVWDNYASVSMGVAEAMGLHEGDVVKVKLQDSSLGIGSAKLVDVPVHIQPGQHDEVIAIALGYGRTAAGKVGNGVGVNVFPLANLNSDIVAYSGAVVTIEKTGEKIKIANVQGHHFMEGRAIVNESNLKDFLKDKESAVHHHKMFSIWPYQKYDGHKWGLSVDLNLCTGCSACTVACHSENNIPVVGKEMVYRGREMHWIRVDRYYVGDPKEAQAVFQPVMCQHCDNAPCETVCPVAATTHSDEGLNDMAYNRCVGTRYCGNNCPYKVRRFNWFNFNKDIPAPMNLVLNPEVTVRMRGVMEKCSFCVQRIKAGKQAAKMAGRPLKDGDIKTACQQACPTTAIVFGDVNDTQSEIHKIFKEDPRSYSLLEEFNAAPAVRYMTKIRNNDKEGSGKHEEGSHS
jgi:molybdopterin-containing oxidoreductase family iron-sulfur binding subunit